MFEDRKFLWQQLNGPQARALYDSKFEMMRYEFEDILEYFKYLSIDSANEEHLMLIANLMNIARPIVEDTSYFNDLFLHSKNPDPPGAPPEMPPYENQGFSGDQPNGFVGGAFAYDENDDKIKYYMDNIYFKRLVKIYAAASMNGKTSLKLIVSLADAAFWYEGIVKPAGYTYPYEIKYSTDNFEDITVEYHMTDTDSHNRLVALQALFEYKFKTIPRVRCVWIV